MSESRIQCPLCGKESFVLGKPCGYCGFVMPIEDPRPQEPESVPSGKDDGVDAGKASVLSGDIFERHGLEKPDELPDADSMSMDEINARLRELGVGALGEEGEIATVGSTGAEREAAGGLNPSDSPGGAAESGEDIPPAFAAEVAGKPADAGKTGRKNRDGFPEWARHKAKPGLARWFGLFRELWSRSLQGGRKVAMQVLAAAQASFHRVAALLKKKPKPAAANLPESIEAETNSENTDEASVGEAEVPLQADAPTTPDAVAATSLPTDETALTPELEPGTEGAAPARKKGLPDIVFMLGVSLGFALLVFLAARWVWQARVDMLHAQANQPEPTPVYIPWTPEPTEAPTFVITGSAVEWAPPEPGEAEGTHAAEK